MKPLNKSNLATQTAAHLREGIRIGTWRGQLPGVLKLAAELGVSKDTVREAVIQLERSGHLKPNRPGQCRTIKAPRKSSKRPLRVGVLLPEPLNEDNYHAQTLMLMVRESIELQGHICFFSEKSLQDFEGNIDRVKKMVTLAAADAWILYAANEKVVEWFAKGKLPAFCIGGHMSELPLSHTRASTVTGIQEAAYDFITHGHRRIVLIAPKAMRKPRPNMSCEAFLNTLRTHNFAVSEYNLPDWDESPDGLYFLLDRLFRITPPTGILTLEPGHAFAVISFLAQRGLKIPEDVSLFCAVPDPIFRWHSPRIGTLDYCKEPHVQKVVQWLHALESGSTLVCSETISLAYRPGGCVGPAKGVKGRK